MGTDEGIPQQPLNRDLLVAITRSLQDAIIALDREGIIIAFHPGAAALLGYTETEVLGRPAALLTPPEEHEEIRGLLQRVVTGQRAELREMVWVSGAGERLLISASVSPIRMESGEIVGVSLLGRDVSHRREREQALHRAKVELETEVRERTAELRLLNQALQAEVVERARTEQAARDQTTVLTRTLEHLSGAPSLDTFLGQVLAAITEQFQSPLSALWLFDLERRTGALHLSYDHGEVLPGETDNHPDAGRIMSLSDGDTIWSELNRGFRPFIIDDLETSTMYRPQVKEYLLRSGVRSMLLAPLILNNQLIGAFSIRGMERCFFNREKIEVAQALATQATLAIQLTRLAEQAQDAAVLDERNRMAREIHDTLAQAFTGVVVQLGAAERILGPEQEDVRAHLIRARDLAREGLGEARHSVQSLRPQALGAGRLSEVLRRMVDQLTAGTSVRGRFQLRGTPYLLPEEVESNLLRIGQEATTNALRHGSPDLVRVELSFERLEVALRVLDNGRGFRPEEVDGHGFGLLGMRERAEAISARLVVASKPGGGTEVSVRVAVPRHAPGLPGAGSAEMAEDETG